MMKDVVSFPDFAKLDLRVGKVVEAEKLAGSEKLIRLKVDLGLEIGEKQILAGIAMWYKASGLVGKKFVFLVNLEVKKMMGSESNGMMLAGDDNGKCLLIPVNKKIPGGTIVR